MKSTKKTNRGRVITLFWLFAGFAGLLSGRLVKLQYVDHQYYLQRADAQHLGEAELPALRGEIRDRNNVVLVPFDNVLDMMAGNSRPLGTMKTHRQNLVCTIDRNFWQNPLSGPTKNQ